MLVFVSVVLFGSNAIGQGEPKVVLVDEFGKPSCEELWAQLDFLSSKLAGSPTSSAVIDISAPASEVPHVPVYWHRMVQNYFAIRKLGPERIRIRMLKLGDEWNIKFWMLPTGTNPPEAERAEWSLKYPSGTKPFVFTNGDPYSVRSGVCLNVDEIGLLARAVDENPLSRVNVVVIVRSDREFARRRATILKELVEDYSISPSRIRMFKKLTKRPNPYGIDPRTEYWLLP
jgi:hypothetical protein